MSRPRVFTVFIALMCASFLGGVVSNLLLNDKELSAEEVQTLKAHAKVASLSGRVNELNTPGGVVYLYGHDGNPRLELGSYSGHYSKAEKGLPLIGFYDNSKRLRMLFRLAGRNQSPVLIFKDTNQRDRIVVGLGLNDPDQEPFIACFDKHGKKHMLLGTY